MTLRKGLFGVGVLLVIAAAACVGDDPATATSSGGTGSCTEAEKSCNGVCTSKDDPNAGCASPECSPCAAVTHGVSSCSAGACSFTCEAGFSDCDGNPANGCEASSSNDLANCGGCGQACGTANTEAGTKCEAGKCVFVCKQGFAHCGAAGDTGCETDLSMSADHCGACGHSCQGGQCVAGKCQPLKITGADDADDVAVDATYVTFTRRLAQSIMRVKKDGTCDPPSPCPQDFTVLDVSIPATRTPVAVASDGTTVFWTADAAAVVGKRAATGGTITSFGTANASKPRYLILAGGKLWWTSTAGNVHVRSANPDGTNVVDVATYTGANGATFAGLGAITADATHVYWASEKASIYRAAFGDPPCIEGPATTLPSCQLVASAKGADGIAVDAANVYWVEPASGEVLRAPKNGGGIPSVIAENQAEPHTIAVLDGQVYWGNAGASGASAGSIRRAKVSGAKCSDGECELVAKVPKPSAIVATDDALYWVDKAANGGIYRLAK